MKAEDWGRKKVRERDHKPCSGCNVISLTSPTSGHEYKNMTPGNMEGVLWIWTIMKDFELL